MALGENVLKDLSWVPPTPSPHQWYLAPILILVGCISSDGGDDAFWISALTGERWPLSSQPCVGRRAALSPFRHLQLRLLLALPA